VAVTLNGVTASIKQFNMFIYLPQYPHNQPINLNKVEWISPPEKVLDDWYIGFHFALGERKMNYKGWTFEDEFTTTKVFNAIVKNFEL
jgi:hypothetical protein